MSNQEERLFKYSTEACLNVVSEDSVFFSLEGIEILKDEPYFYDFHIYMILAKPRYCFAHQHLKITEKGIKIEILDENEKFFTSFS